MTWSLSRVSRVLFLLALIVLAMAASTWARELKPWQAWQSTVHADHELAGKIWSVGAKKFVRPEELINRLGQAKYVLVGEIHDNGDHHRLQAWVISRLAGKMKPAVVMEMIDADQADKLAAYRAGPDASAAGLGAALNWQNSGWPAWPLYQPIAEEVFKHDLPLLPGDAGRPDMRKISRNGLEALNPAERRALALDKPLPLKLAEALIRTLEASHCGLLPKRAFEPMSQVQRFRDAHLARALVDVTSDGKKGGAILIAGNGHIRTDRAVPWYLARQAPGVKLAAIALVEIAGEDSKVKDLVFSGPDGKPAADYFWFTPRVEREDPCVGLRKRMKRR